MRAVRVERFGGPEVLVAAEVPDPVAEPGQVVIDVAAADTLFVETQIRSGTARQWFAVEPPYVPGGAVAGRVSATGRGVDAAWAGRTVAACTPDSQGGYAERVAVPAEALLAVPDGLDPTWAAALMHDGVTGLAVLDAAEVKPGDRVLVTAAAGGMGILLVQLARAAGARVTAAARGERKLDLAQRMGADVVVDYTEPGWAEHVREVTGGPDVVFDGAGGRIGQAAFAIAAPGARFSAHGAAGGGFSAIDPAEAGRRQITVRGIQDVQLGLAERNRLAERAMAEAAAGRLEPVIGRTFPLVRAAEAHAAIEAREVPGKALLLP